MAVVMKRQRRRGFFRIFFSFLAFLLILLIAGAAGLWYIGPDLIAPREEFTQGPGGVVAYISLSTQLRTQTQAFLSGQDVRLAMNQDEFSGMVSSALLSNRQAGNPVRKVRAFLPEGQIQVDTILELPYDKVPEQFRDRPIGLTLDLQPTVTESGDVQFRIIYAKVGRIRVPVSLIKWAGRRIPVAVAGFDAKEATIALPVGDLIASNFGRNINIKEFTSHDGQLALVMNMPQKKK